MPWGCQQKSVTLFHEPNNFAKVAKMRIGTGVCVKKKRRAVRHGEGNNSMSGEMAQIKR